MKKAIMIVLSILLIFGLVSCSNEVVPPESGGGDAGDAGDAGDVPSLPADTFDGTDVASAEELREAFEEGGKIRLTEDIVLDEYIEAKKALELYGNGKTLTIGAPESDYGNSGIFITSDQDVLIRNLTVVAGGAYPKDTALVYLSGNNGYVKLENLVLECNPEEYATSAIGILTSYTSAGTLTVKDCEIRNAKYGMYFNSIKDSVIKGNTIDGALYNGINIAADNAEKRAEDIIITDNVLKNVASENYPVDQYNCGIYIGPNSDDTVTVDYNTIVLAEGSEGMPVIRL